MTAVVRFKDRPKDTLTIDVPCGLASIDSWFRSGYVLHRNIYYPMSSVENIQVYA